MSNMQDLDNDNPELEANISDPSNLEVDIPEFDNFQSNANFNKDISELLPSNLLDNLSSYLDQNIQDDIQFIKPRISYIKSIINFLWPGANGTLDNVSSDTGITFQNQLKGMKNLDSNLSAAILQLWSNLTLHLLPYGGPIGTKNEANNDVDQNYIDALRDTLNEYLTNKDAEYYADYRRGILYLIVYGYLVRKIYTCPVTKEKISRFILPENSIFERNCLSFAKANRFTNIIKLSRREIILNMESGDFRKIELPYLKMLNNYSASDNVIMQQDSNSMNNSYFTFYQTYEYLKLDSFLDANNGIDFQNWDLEYNLPAPYIITKCAETKQILSIVRDWKQGDYTKERINSLAVYTLYDGFDSYGTGLAQLAGVQGIALNELQKLSIQAALFQNFPGGIRGIQTGARNQNFKPPTEPGEWSPVETTTMEDIRNTFMTLPYPGPSPAILEWHQVISGQLQKIAGISLDMLANNTQNMPVGTTLALFEIQNKFQSAILANIYNIFQQEIRILAKAFNFEPDEVKLLIPICEPNISSVAERVIKAETVLDRALAAPDLHNMHEVYKEFYTSMGIKNVDKLLLTPEELQQREAAAAEQQQMPQYDPLAVQMADIEQRKMETESKERIARLEMEGKGYVQQSDIELDKQKLELQKYMADLKAAMNEDNNEVKLEIEKQKAAAQSNTANSHVEDALLRIEPTLKKK